MARKIKSKNKDWIEEYAALRPLYERFTLKLKELLKELIASQGIQYHAIECRAKDIDSFSEKIKRAGKSYHNPIQQLSDLAGVRVILYYQEDVESICNLIESEFSIDTSRSEDKRAQLAPDQFGYISVHQIISLGDTRSKLPEWSTYKDLVAEIQVRTVLQHAWASISQALQYKREQDIPKDFRRKLVRLAGLLELGDEQFSELRKQQLQFTEVLARRIVKKDLSIDIDFMSLIQYLGDFKAPKTITDAAIAAGFKVHGLSLGELELIPICNHLGLNKLDVLDNELKKLGRHAKAFFTEFALNHKGAEGSVDHWNSVILFAAHKSEFSKDVIYRFIHWEPDYIRNALRATEVIS